MTAPAGNLFGKVGRWWSRIFGERSAAAPASTQPRAEVQTGWEPRDHHDVVAEHEVVSDPWDAAGSTAPVARRDESAGNAAPVAAFPDPGATAATCDDADAVDDRPAPSDATMASPAPEPSLALQPCTDDAHRSETADAIWATSPESGTDAEITGLADVAALDEWKELEQAEEDALAAEREGGADVFAPAQADLQLAFDLPEPTPAIEPDDAEAVAAEAAARDGAAAAELLEQATDAEAAFEDEFGDTEEVADPLDDPAAEFTLDNYDGDARQLLWQIDPDDDLAHVERRARDKAARIAAMLEVTSVRERDHAVSWLTELFRHLNHPATFRAIEAAAKVGISPYMLHAMTELRQTWVDRPEWWMMRTPRGDIYPMRHGRSALSWVTAAQICKARLDHPPELMIDEDWFDEWLELAPGEPGYLSFPHYLAVKTSTHEAELLDDGLNLAERLNGWSETADDWEWFRKVPCRDVDLLRSFRILTPYDLREGMLGPSEADPKKGDGEVDA